MTPDQLALMARILNGLCTQWLLPYVRDGLNVGICRYCGIVGKVQYPDVAYEHKPDCVIALNEQLQQSLTNATQPLQSGVPA